MINKNLTAKKNWVGASVIFLILISLLMLTLVSNCDKEPERIVAPEEKPADINQAPAEHNEPDKPGDPNEEKHEVFAERIEERKAMVTRQIAARKVKDVNVLAAMRKVPRHAFIPPGRRRHAYIDSPLPIEHGQTISQPYIVAFMTEALQLDPNSKVLEIGTGSGYQAAVCAEIAREVYTIEIIEELAESATKILKELCYDNVIVKAGDGFYGWPEHAPFDAIIGTAAAGRVPEPLLEQLKPGGRMILPVGSFGFQHLILITKDEEGNLQQRNVMPVRFVPMTGEVQKPKR